MSILIVAAAFSSLLFYALAIERYISPFLFYRKPKVISPPFPFVSVIIAMRNEEKNISKCLESLREQNYPENRFEIILIDDHSEDNTKDIIDQLNIENLICLNNPEKGKKSAILHGMEKAKGEYYLFTDADCTVGKKWISNYIHLFQTNGAEMITGPVVTSKRSGFLSAFQEYDLTAWSVISNSAINGHLHAMANGGNMAIKKGNLDEIKNEIRQDYSSGDDLFLAAYFFDKNELAFNDLVGAEVYTQPIESWTELLSQRIRWASKNRAMKNEKMRDSFRAILALNIVLTIGIIVGLTNKSMAIFILIVLLIKSILDFTLIKKGFKSQNKSTSFIKVLCFQIPAVLLVTLPAIAVLFMADFKWKGRKLSN